jgi:hypothetical protein
MAAVKRCPAYHVGVVLLLWIFGMMFPTLLSVEN